MVRVIHDCNCKTCPGNSAPPARPGEGMVFGGTICHCRCHEENTYSDTLTELGVLLGENFAKNRRAVRLKLLDICKSLKVKNETCIVEKKNYKGIKYLCEKPHYANGMCRQCYNRNVYLKKIGKKNVTV